MQNYTINLPINTNNPPNINANAENARATLSSVDRAVGSKHHIPIDVSFDDSLIKSHDIVAAIPNPNATTPRSIGIYNCIMKWYQYHKTPRSIGTPYEHLLWVNNNMSK